MTNWQPDVERLRAVRDAMAEFIVGNFPGARLPRYRMDGRAITTAIDLANASGIPYAEAKVRIADQADRYPYERESKDVHTGTCTTTRSMGVGTVVERSAAIAYRRRRKRKKRDRT